MKISNLNLLNFIVPLFLILSCGSVGNLPSPIDVRKAYGEYFLPQNDEAPTGGAIKVTWLGTTTLLIDDGETQLMIDGFLSRPNWRNFELIKTNEELVNDILSRFKVHRLQAIFGAHSHYDHVLDVAHLVKQTGARLYGSESTLNVGYGGGLSGGQMSLFEPGKELIFGEFKVTVIKAKHSPQHGLFTDIGKVIGEPLGQPAHAIQYSEGNSFDFLIKHGDNSILVKPSANWLEKSIDFFEKNATGSRAEGMLEGIQADVLFLATATLGSKEQSNKFRKNYYEQTVGYVQPKLVIPIHWDSFFSPLNEYLPPLSNEDVSVSFDFLIEHLEADNIRFGILQGTEHVMLFDENGPGK